MVERDVKITFTTFISLVGGYMGLFTGFSILSGVEILYFLAKFFFSLRLLLPPESCPRLVILLKAGKLDPWKNRFRFSEFFAPGGRTPGS